MNALEQFWQAATEYAPPGILIHLFSAWAAGSLIGLERTFHGRPAGFRTHALVCVASSLLMLLTSYQGTWMTNIPVEALRTDPTRMAQGIMTGIGFLGAGVIFKEGLTVRGLTTAASIWVTAALGVLFGAGFYFPAMIGTAITLGTLAVFRWVENLMPAQFFAHLHMRFPKDQAPSEEKIRQRMADHGFSVANLSYEMTDGGTVYAYRMVIMTSDRGNVARLAEEFRASSEVLTFILSPTD